METVQYFINALIVGLLVSIPLGPIGVLCIQKTITKGWSAGFAAGLGAAVSDVLYAIIAAFSLTFIITFLKANHIIFELIGASILILLGVKIFYTNPAKQLRKTKQKGNNLFSDFISTFFLTISNPLAIVLIMALLASFELVKEEISFQHNIILIIGVFLGATSWWATLTWLVNLFRKRISLRRLWWINKITGAGIVIFSIVISIILAIK